MSILVRILIVVLGLGAVAGLGAWGYRTIYDAGLTAGRAEVQAKWDADRIEVQRLADMREATNAHEAAAAAKLNQETIDDYKAKADAAAASAADYARRLHDAQARLAAGSVAVPAAHGEPGPAPAATPPSEGSIEPGVPTQIDALVGARLAECDANEAQLRALEAEVAPQVAPP